MNTIKQNVVTEKWWFTNHALQKCDQRNIDIEKLIMSVVQAELVEDYPDDPRGHSCLILSVVDDKAVHSVCGLHENGTIFITAYYPELPKWLDKRTRRLSEVKKCYICNGDVAPGRVSVEREWNGKKMIIEDVPAKVCEQCGEQYFDGETTLRLEKIKKAAVFPQEQTVQVPTSVRDFKNLTHMENG